MDNKDFLIYSKCCFCIPLRFGLLTWAYVKLALIVVVTYLMVNIIKQVTSNSEAWHISALLVLLFVELCLTVMFIIAGHKKNVAVVLLATFLAMYLYRIIRMYNRIPYPGDLHGMAIIGVLLEILLIEFCFTVTFVIGGHMKNLKPMRVFYVYNMVMVVITLVLMMILVGLMLRDMDPSHVVSYYSWNFLLTMANFFFTLLVQIYFILLIRSEILKLEGKYGFSFVNNAAEEECIMRGDTQIEEDWKTIEDLEENKTGPSAMQDGNEKSCEQGLRYPS